MRLLDGIALTRGGDVRVLKSQLDIAAQSTRSMLFTAPLWSLLIALLCSNFMGPFGGFSLAHVFYLPVLVTGATLLSSGISMAYLGRTGGDVTLDTVRLWSLRLTAVQFGISAAWGFMPWLLWKAGDPLNHMFLAACIIAAISSLVVGRGSNMPIFIARLVPVSLMTALRFALGDSALDYAIAAAEPLFALQMWFIGRSLVGRMREDSRLSFQVGDLARELEETRDEALKKRFEAETANASKTAFLANMSHELRTPLNAILGFSEIISEECFGPVGNARYKDYAGDIHSSGAHLLSLINDLLDIAKIEAGRMEISPNPLDARRTFEIALKLIGSKASEKRQQLIIHMDPGAPLLYADERALKQILINLVSNAVKFTPDGGRIDVIASAANDGGFQILVKDNGPGIAREKLDNIFSPFSQVDNRYDRQAGGTGLGLALVRGLAELHGGRAWIESDENAGCAAYVVLPVKAPALTAKAAAA